MLAHVPLAEHGTLDPFLQSHFPANHIYSCQEFFLQGCWTLHFLMNLMGFCWLNPLNGSSVTKHVDFSTSDLTLMGDGGLQNNPVEKLGMLVGEKFHMSRQHALAAQKSNGNLSFKAFGVSVSWGAAWLVEKTCRGWVL